MVGRWMTWAYSFMLHTREHRNCWKQARRLGPRDQDAVHLILLLAQATLNILSEIMFVQLVLARKCLQVDVLISSYQNGYQTTKLGEHNTQNRQFSSWGPVNIISSSTITHLYQCGPNKTRSGNVLEKGTGNERSPKWSAGALKIHMIIHKWDACLTGHRDEI